MEFLKELDYSIAFFIRKHINTPGLNRVLSRINRGEALLLIIVPFLIYGTIYKTLPHSWWITFFYTALVSYANDRFVLVLKKAISRKRPLLTVAGKIDENPDMKHSFPSAHAANSMTAVILLVFLFGFPPWFLVFTFLAGLGRLLSLHHFPSDVAGGWLIGCLSGGLGLFFGSWLFAYFNI
ncbi:phosphatase PAP2 family protein [Leptospira perolatii]|uniref:Phosphatase PAP2 family protein n=1 Tax=Leptospira perolatii TaxID=2023191 RepID=A0A2M9ZRL0_9LEPT|nr:phosphatase PAP2 family protein [Leptospira perolatii]PJZ71041.1 phosphatase PAP2 family protein [Leptospira perolatii]PJZ74573.1 phosphatase PAP2 family protein [Leptospira perolatii]